MELSDSPLSIELDLINQSDTGNRYVMYEAVITTENEPEIPTLKVVSMDQIMNYRKAATDEIIIEIAMAAGTFLKRVMPFKENLTISLTKTPVGNFTPDNPREVVVQEFKAFLLTSNQQDTMGNRPAVATEDAANLSGMIVVSFQLQDIVYDQIRSAMVGGVFKMETPFGVLKALLFKTIAELQTDEANLVDAIELMEPNNTTKRDHILVDHGTPLIALADVLQVKLGGIYNSGIGAYLQRGVYSVWGLYDNTRYDEAEKTATFIILPDPRMKGTEKTYRKVGPNHFVAIITGGVTKQDVSEMGLLNQGNAVRFQNTDKAMEGFVETAGNKAVAKRTENANEYKGVERRGDNTMSRVSTDMGYSNAFHEASKLIERNLAFVTLVWENSDPTLIFGGLQCELGYTVDGKPEYVNGVVVHAHAYTALAGTGLHQQVLQTVTEVVIAVDRDDPTYKAWLAEKEEGGAATQ